MKFFKILLFIGLIFNTIIIKAQERDKIGGVCFRIDDVQTPSNLRALDSVFTKHGKHFTYAPNPQIAYYAQTNEFWNTLKTIQNKGNEIGDHTPNHYTHFFEVSNADSSKYKNRKGIDHIKKMNIPPVYGTRVCLKYNILDANGVGDENNVDVKNNMLISKTNGEFSNQKIYGNSKSVIYFYLPTLNQVVGFHGFNNANSNDPDTANIRTFWNEDIDLGTISNIPYKKLSNYDVEIDKDGFRMMLQFSLDIFKNKGINAPTVWIQPGGETPYLSKKFIAKICGEEYGYKSAATYPGAVKGFNEVDYERNKSFNMQWQDFQEENQTVEQIKSIIVDRFARHALSFGSNHLGVFGANFPLQTIISNIDQILGWCIQNNIPVYTYSEWANILYKSQPNPDNNIFPPLQNDLNKDGIVDGYSSINGLDTVSGLSQSNYRALTATSSQTMFQINRLSGIESGANTISLFSKGGTGNRLSFYIDFPEINKYVQFELPANTSNYSAQNYTFNVPKGVSYTTIICNSLINNGSLTITAMSLKGVNKPYVKLPILKRNSNERFSSINLKNYVIDKFNPIQDIKWSVINNRIFTTNINLSNELFVSMNNNSNTFWVGYDSIQIVAKSISSSDTVWLNIVSAETRVCANQKLVINYNKTSADSLLSWSSIPANQSILSNNTEILTVYPGSNVTYTLKVIKFGGEVKTNPITIDVIPTKFIDNTVINRGFQSNSTLSVSFNLPFYSTGLVTKQPNRDFELLSNNEIRFTMGSLLGNDTLVYKITTQACDVNDITIITSEKNIGIKELTEKNIAIYPNPTEGLFKIIGENEFSYTIYDGNGKEIISGIKNAAIQNLDLRNQKSGIYFIKLYNNKEQFTTKIIKE